ncbi:MAG: hypothetical protein L0J77_13070 [Marinobacter sp.]|nr:hypothetical protein [Marinobacter sp.]
MSEHATYDEYKAAAIKLNKAISSLDSALDKLKATRTSNPGEAVLKARAKALKAETQVEQCRDDVIALIRSHWIPNRDYDRPDEPNPEVLRRAAALI